MTETVKSQYDMRDPRTQYPQPPFPKQPQDKPGFDHKMEPKADHGENSYQGFGRLKDRKALITGGDSGIGRAIAIAYAREGAEICINYLPEEKEDADWVCDLLEGEGHAVHRMPGNLTDKEFCNTLIKEAHERMGGLDILVNNAGVSWRPLRPVSDATLSDWKFMIDVNLWGVINGLDVFLPRMSKQQGEKHVVNTSSLAGLWPVKGHTPYSATKAAVTAISEGLASDLAEEGFGVTILHPAMVRTNVVANSEAMRSDVDKGEGRTFRSMVDERMEKLAAAYIDAEAVGEMVRDAIERNQLYLHTHPIEAQDIRSRTELIYGADTYGRA